MSTTKGLAKVIVAFDGSKDSAKAMKLAVSLASKFLSEVIVVHVYSSPSVGFGAASGVPIPDYRALEDAKKDSARKTLSQGLALAKEEGINAKGELIEAPSVVEALVEFATKEGADMIVVGTRGMTGFKKLLLGSVSTGLANHSPCPVLIAR